MVKNLLVAFVLAALLVTCSICLGVAMADDTLVAGSAANTTSEQADRIKILESQVQLLQDQNKQLLDLVQKMAESSKQDAATPTQDAKLSAPAAAKDQYTPGWRAKIISVPYNFNISDKLPALELGGFVHHKSDFKMYDYLNTIKDAPKANYPLWKGEAFLDVEEPGNYVFSISPQGSGYSGFRMAIFIEDVLIASAQNPRNNMDNLIGAAELEAGLYKVEFRAVDIPENVFGSATDGNNGFILKIKRPSDDQGVPIADVLLVKKASADVNKGKKKK